MNQELKKDLKRYIEEDCNNQDTLCQKLQVALPCRFLFLIRCRASSAALQAIWPWQIFFRIALRWVACSITLHLRRHHINTLIPTAVAGFQAIRILIHKLCIAFTPSFLLNTCIFCSWSNIRAFNYSSSRRFLSAGDRIQSISEIADCKVIYIHQSVIRLQKQPSIPKHIASPLSICNMSNFI